MSNLKQRVTKVEFHFTVEDYLNYRYSKGVKEAPSQEEYDFWCKTQAHMATRLGHGFFEVKVHQVP